MGMRVTTSMMMNTYRYNLQGSTSNLSDARNKVLTHRKFDSYSEDPASATMAWRIRRAMYSNSDYQTNNSDTYSRFNIAWTTMGVVNNQLSDEDGRAATIRGLTDSTAAGRKPLGQVLSNGAETIVQAMNSAKYGDHFVFAGNDEMNVPFSWSADMKTLYYRGINVGAGAVKRPDVMPEWANNPTKPSWADSPIDDNTGCPEDMPSAATGDAWEDKWIKYYEDLAAYNKGTTTTPPVKPEVPQGMPAASTENDPIKKAWEEAWIQYYNDKTSATPTGINMPEEVPAWTKSAKVDANGAVQGMPATPNEWDKAWEKYLKDPENETKPTLDPSESNETKWGKPDQFGIPSNIEKVKQDAEDALAADPDNKDAQADLAWVAYYLDQGDVKKLEALSKEEQNIDLGMGLQEDKNGNLINGSAFNRSLPGINMLGGYGFDEDGDPRNVVLIMKRLGEICSGCDPETGKWATDAEGVEANRLLGKLIDCRDRTTEALDDIDTKGHFLQENQARLEEQGDYLQEERANIEDVDLADAITEFSWDYYCYSAALKIGTQLLSQSLLDYMG